MLELIEREQACLPEEIKLTYYVSIIPVYNVHVCENVKIYS